MTAAPALELDDVSAGYGETVVLEKVALALNDGETLAIIGRNGVGKTTLLATIMGHTTRHGGRLRLHGRDIAELQPYRRALAGLGLRAAGARDLPVAERARKPRGRRPSRALDARGGVRAVPEAQGAPGQPRQSALRRRAADAGDRPRADRQPFGAADGRAIRGPGAGDRRGADAGREAARAVRPPHPAAGRAEHPDRARRLAAHGGDGPRPHRLRRAERDACVRTPPSSIG